MNTVNKRSCFNLDCIDTNKKSCRYWNETGYCSQTEKYPRLLKVCALTCGACFPCQTPLCTTGKLS